MRFEMTKLVQEGIKQQEFPVLYQLCEMHRNKLISIYAVKLERKYGIAL
jgi:hypothetical protein